MWVTHILVATHPPWASVDHTQLLETANEIQSTFIGHMLFIYCYLSPVALLLYSSVCCVLPYSFFFLGALLLFFFSVPRDATYTRRQMETGDTAFYWTPAVRFYFGWLLSLPLIFWPVRHLLCHYAGARTLFPRPSQLMGQKEG